MSLWQRQSSICTKPTVLYGETTTDTMVNSKAMTIRIYRVCHIVQSIMQQLLLICSDECLEKAIYPTLDRIICSSSKNILIDKIITIIET